MRAPDLDDVTIVPVIHRVWTAQREPDQGLCDKNLQGPDQAPWLRQRQQ